MSYISFILFAHVSFRVRLHIFNLYHFGPINKELIKEKQLNLFKLAFWFSFCQNGEYIRVSPISCTRTIRESKIIYLSVTFYIYFIQENVAGRKVQIISGSNVVNNP